MSASLTDNLVLLVTRKLQCLQQLQKMGAQQRALIGVGDIEKLMEFLAEKDRWVTAMHAIEVQLKPFHHQAPEQFEWRTPEQHAQCQAALDACQRLLREIVQEEKECERQLLHRRDEAALQMQDVHRASQAARAYVATETPSGGQLDLTSDS